ncbi:MAG: hypothetical protein ABIZ95_05535 [Pyrinomonadaceae bacterium]
MNRIDSFSFAKDGMHGWIIESRYRPLLANEVRGAPHSNYSSGGNHILSSFIKFTQDGGVSWKAQTIKPTWNSLDSITAIDSTHAIAYGIAGVYFLDGNQWKPAESVSDGENSTSSCLDAACGSGCRIPTTIQFVDSQTGWIANTNGYVGRSMDGGKTWSDISRDLWQGYVDHMYGVQVQFVDHYSGWGINGNGWLVTSQDGGTSWHIVNDNRWYAGMFFLDSKHGWAVSNDGIFKIAEDHRPN